MRKALLVLANSARGLSTYPAVYQCANELKERNFHVTIVTDSTCDDENIKCFFDEVHIIQAKGWLDELLKYTKFIIQNNYEYVICFDPNDAKNVAIASIFNRFNKYIYYNLEISEKPSEIIPQEIPNDRPLYIWGAGKFGQKAIQWVRQSGFKATGFIDNNSAKWGEEFEGLPIHSPLTLEKSNADDRPYVIIGSMYIGEISAQLRELGYDSKGYSDIYIVDFRDKAMFFVNKILEKLYCYNSCCMVIQDAIREKISAKHGIKHKCTYYIPNTYYSHSMTDNDSKKCTGSLFFSGGFEELVISEIINDVNQYNHSLTLSGWDRGSGYLERNKDKLAKKNITIIEHKLSPEEYVKLVKQYDIGLVWYSRKCDNAHFIGRSSGKLFMYLSCGKPVIVKNLPGMADDVKKYKLGKVIDSLAEIPEAIEEIVKDYPFYENNVKNAFVEIFDYKKSSKAFFDKL
ncbi:hypothetical protein [Anaerospora sp.]|uniref:hypothetical protein n=1 Tax=Anaerospora sp. TaxID=1960278 RepID=UPI00289DEF49|nr:hypothetical protein [Anaerospora sp.]